MLLLIQVGDLEVVDWWYGDGVTDLCSNIVLKTEDEIKKYKEARKSHGSEYSEDEIKYAHSERDALIKSVKECKIDSTKVPVMHKLENYEPNWEPLFLYVV